jgi:ketosteroid isomerase-like protein
MSRENVELMRQGIDAFNRRDFDAVLRAMDPAVELEHRLAALEGRFVGHDGVRRWLEDLVGAFDAWSIACPDIRDLGDHVLALGQFVATGKESGAEATLPFTVLARVERGRVTRFTDFGDRDRALEAAGLSE